MRTLASRAKDLHPQAVSSAAQAVRTWLLAFDGRITVMLAANGT
jgi:hypothetical protein